MDTETASPTGAQWITRFLEARGVQRVAGIPGGAVLPLYRALADAGIDHVLTRHEQGAGFVAQGMARASGRAGVCIVTSGPGLTNLLTALADARADSVPMVAIVGQVPRALRGTDAFQEVDTAALVASVTKACVEIRDPDDLPGWMHEAFRVAESGRAAAAGERAREVAVVSGRWRVGRRHRRIGEGIRMTELFDLVRDMLMLAVTVLLPLVLAGAAGAVVGGLVVMWLGLQDQGLATMIRGLGVVLAVALTGAAAFDGAVQQTSAAWEHVEDIGRDGVAMDGDG